MKQEQPAIPTTQPPVSTSNVSPIDPLTALEMELNRSVETREVLTYFAYGAPILALRAAEILRRYNVDMLIALLEAPLAEKLSLQEDIYYRLDEMLGSHDKLMIRLALDIVTRSTSAQARLLLQEYQEYQRPA